MKDSSLSVCLIAKNEGMNIARCLASVVDIGDEIIVVDTGSTDDTVEITKNFGAIVIQHSWEQDFSAARNIALDHATCDWILTLDCDEELEGSSKTLLLDTIQSDSYEAYMIWVTNCLENNRKASFSSIRLFRNRPHYRYEGKIHEQIVNSILNHCDLNAIGEADIVLLHHGYNANSANIEEKTNRNLSILENIEEEERDGFFYYNLATEYLRKNELKKALKNYLKAIKHTKPNQGYGPILIQKFITTLMMLYRYQDAIEQLNYYIDLYKDYQDLYYLMGSCHLHCGRYSKALFYLKQYVDMPQASKWYPSEEYLSKEDLDQLIHSVEKKVLNHKIPPISVCIIAKDEARQISSCIQSINELAHEVILINNDSSDRTKGVAYQLGATVYDVNLENSYSKLRNYAIDKASGEWIFFINGDEVLPEEESDKLVHILCEPKYNIYSMIIYTFLGNDTAFENCYASASYRLFKKMHDLYSNPILETIIDLAQDEKQEIGHSHIGIYHMHYMDTFQHIVEKRNRKIEVLKQLCNHNEPLAVYGLAIEAFYSKEYDTALEYFQALFSIKDKSLIPPDSFYHYGLLLINLKDYTVSLRLLEEGIQLYDDYTDLYYLKAMASHLCGKLQAAEESLKKCIHLGDSPIEKYKTAIGTGSFKALESLGNIYMHRDNHKDAVDVFLKLSHDSIGCKAGIRGLGKVFLQMNSLNALEDLLQKNSLYTPKNLQILSTLYQERKQWKDSLYFLEKSISITTQITSEFIQSCILSYDQLILSFIHTLSADFPDNPYIQSML